MLKLRRRNGWGGKSWFVVAVLKLRGRGGFAPLYFGCGFLGSFDDIDGVEDGIEAEDVRFGRLIVGCRVRLAKPGFLLKLAEESVG